MPEAPLRLAIFDVDGTLIDSQHLILTAMRAAFDGARLRVPTDPEILSIVGLSLPIALARLAPGLDATTVSRLVEAYKEAFIRVRAETGGERSAPLYPGARAALERLDAAGWLLGVATGKARRGLDHMLDAHDLRGFFVTTQTADDAPSKPHPGMVENALGAAGVEARDAVMIGDTSFDVTMAVSAGVPAIGVSWGYHAVPALRAAGAAAVIDHFDALDAAIDALAGEPT